MKKPGFLFPSRLASGVLCVSVTLLAGCDKPPDVTSPARSLSIQKTSADRPQRGTSLPQFPELNDSIEAVEVGVHPEPRQYDVDDAALIDAVRGAGGKVAIGFKPPDAPSVRSTGVIPSMSKAQALEGRRAIEALGAKITRTYRTSSSVIAEIRPELAPSIRRLPIVNYVDILHERRPAGLPLVTAMAAVLQAPQDTTWGHFQVGAHRAWLKGHVGSGAFITILDGGVDSVHMFTLYGDANDIGFECLWTEPTFDECWEENNGGHGSLVHSVALSLNNPWGYVGIANTPRGNAMVKVCTATSCETEDIAGGLDWTATNGYGQQVVNMSIEGDNPDDLEREFVQRSANAGNLLVAAGGNVYPPANMLSYPAAYDEVIGVSGTDQYDGFADGTRSPCIARASRYGSHIELAAPFWAWGMDENGSYHRLCGTSFANPVVTATAALVWTINPGWSATSVRQRLRDTALDLGSQGRDDLYGYGRVDACAATNSTGCSPLDVRISGPAQVQPGQYCTWNAVVTGGVSPYSYQWSGLVSGSGPSVSATLWTSGQIRVDVTDTEDQQTNDVISVTVTWNAPDCLF